MKFGLDLIRLTLEDELPELRAPGTGSIVAAVLLYFLCNGIALGIYSLIRGGETDLAGFLAAFLLFNLLSYGIGRLLNGPSSDMGQEVFRQSGRMGFFRFGGGAAANMALVGLLLMLVQFLFFGVYACVEQFREAVQRRGDNRSRVAAGVLKFLLEQGPAPEADVYQGLRQAGVSVEQSGAVVEFLKEKSMVKVQDHKLDLTLPAQKLFPKRPTN